MSAAFYQHGETVDITIRNARVREVKHYGDGNGACLKFEYAHPSGQMMPDALFYEHPDITVTRQGGDKTSAPLDRARVDRALRAVIADLDYDLHKALESDEETGEDTYHETVAAFIKAYEADGAGVDR